MAKRSRLLRNRDLAALLAVLPELYAPTVDRSWTDRIVQATRGVLDHARVSYNIADLRNGNARYCLDTEFRDDPNLRRLLYADERLIRWRAGFDAQPTLLTDRLATSEIKKTDIFNEYYRPAKVMHQMAFALHRTREHQYFVAITRWENFTERERSIAAALQPHLARVMQTAIPRQEWREARATKIGPDLSPTDHTIALLRDLSLTPRQAEVLYWISQGKRDSEIAIILGASVRTIHHHVEAVLRSLGVETRQAAMLRAVAVLGLPK